MSDRVSVSRITDDMVERAAQHCWHIDAEQYADFPLSDWGKVVDRERFYIAARTILSAALAGYTVVEQPAEPVDELAARVLNDHLLTGPLTGQCRCGWGDGSDVRTLGRSHSKHVVGQLRAAGALAMAAAGSQVGDQ